MADSLWQLGCWDGRWHGWSRHDDGMVLGSAPAVASLGPDHAIVFVIGADRALWSKTWRTGIGWSSWERLGSNKPGLVGAPVATTRGRRVCNVYIRGGDHALWQVSWRDGAWRGWDRHDSDEMLAADPAAVTLGPGQEILFAVGINGQVRSKVWTAAAGWGGWDSLGAPDCGVAGGVCAISRHPNVVTIYARGTDNALWQRGFRDGGWRDWYRHEDGAALTSEPAASTGGPNHELVVHRGRDGELYIKWWEPNLSTVDVNLVQVGGNRCATAGELAMARWICFQAGLDVGGVNHFRIGSGQAGTLEIIDSVAEAEELTERWSARNNALDVFVVRAMNVANGWSTIDGSGDWRFGDDAVPSNDSVAPNRGAGHSPIVCGVCRPEPRVRAMSLLAEERPTYGRKIFRIALRDDSADVTVRAAAATWLSRFAAEEAQPALLAALEIERSTPVLHKIIAGLARVGDEDALPMLANLVRSKPNLATHAAFAQSVIAHRVGIGGYEPASADESPLAPAPNGARARRVLEPHEAPSNGSALPDDTYGLILGPGVAGLRCGGRRLAIAIDLTALARLLTTPTIAALVATRAGDALHTSMLVLCWPATDNAAHVAVHRPNGTRVFAGSAKVTGATVSFHLTAVRSPGARRSTITGTISSGILNELNVSSGPALPAQTPEPS